MTAFQALSIAGVCERDLDLLLLEELKSSMTFCQWFVSRVAPWPSQVRTVRTVRRSVTQSSGESDLELTVELESGTVARLLIVNKINAGFQPDQSGRYRIRSHMSVANSECADCATVLVAPARYFGADDGRRGFDARITYEEIRSWFMQSDLGPRIEYKVALLTGAIEKGVLGYQPQADAPVTDFWREYWLTALRLAPELEMSEPDAKPAAAGFIYFRPAALPHGIELCHKLRQGNVDLQFSGWGTRINALYAVVATHLDPGMRLAQANKSAAIRLRTHVLNTGEPFAAQEAKAIDGIRAASALLAWYGKHRTVLLPLGQGPV